MLRLGIPEYRLPRELIKLEVNAILSLGVDLRIGQRLGKDFTVGDLKERGYRAIFIAIGSHRSRDLEIQGVDLDGVLKGVDFLLNVNMGYRTELGEKVLVIGGGNVAIDVARSALRAAVPSEVVNTRINIVTALDVARSALRFGVKEVHVVCLESSEEMPADADEIEEARREGISFHHRRGPVRILGGGGSVVGLETIECSSVFDAEGRFNPTFVPGTELAMSADTVILAIGQTSDLSWLRPEDHIAVTKGGTIDVDPETLATTAPGIYSGGDVAFGPRIAISAIADGRRAASSIHAYLCGTDLGSSPIEIDIQPLSGFTREHDFESVPRQKPPSLPIDRRVGIAEIEACFPEDVARLEASRCFRCWINTVFDEDRTRGTECILCGGCADVCPEDCIEFIPAGDLLFDPGLKDVLVSEFGDAADVLLDQCVDGAVLVKDETVCIRCGLCARRCPAGTITMQAFHIREPSSA